MLEDATEQAWVALRDALVVLQQRWLPAQGRGYADGGGTSSGFG